MDSRLPLGLTFVASVVELGLARGRDDSGLGFMSPALGSLAPWWDCTGAFFNPFLFCFYGFEC